MPPQQNQRDLSFRESDISYILSRVQAGDCCSVVGVGSVGKSNLLRHLRRPDTQRYHLGEGSAANLKIVLVDPNNMLDSIPLLSGEVSSWAGYEIMVHRLYKTFYPFEGFSDEQIKQIRRAYHEIRKGDNQLLSHIGLRYLELALEELLGQDSDSVAKDRKIAFIFDEFEEMLANLPAKFFQTLRGIRDDYKYQLTYITFTRRSIPQIIDENRDKYNKLLLEPFVELFTDSTRYLGPYAKTDATAMLDRLSKRRNTNYSPSFRNFLLRASGGHAGMLRASFGLASQIAFGTPESEALRFLSNSQEIRAECQTVWESLTQPERIILKRVMHSPVVDPSELAVNLLEQKQLLKNSGGDNRVEINPPLFREFVRDHAILEPQEN
jgi:hypothetical protein